MRHLLPALLVFLLPTSALACGGMFCSSQNLQPVQQNAERILFEMNGDGTITATVEIRYEGEPSAFSWVVPVPTELGPDDLDVEAPSSALLLLDDATQPRVIPPPTDCTTPDPPPMLGAFDSEVSLSMAPGADGVEVTDLPAVGPFQPQLLEATDADALVDWLNDNDYLITAEMEPLIAEYVADDMFFLALKLTPGAGVEEISPISMTYEGDQPMIPIQLTGVGAEPEMGLLAFVAGESRFESTNYENLDLSLELLQWNPANNQRNYYPMLSWQMDEAGGQAVVTQFAGDLSTIVDTVNNTWSWNTQYEDDLAWLTQIGQEHGQITRLYSRMSSWEMTADPMFAESTGEAVSATLDLSDRATVDICAPNAGDRVPCGDMYCGVDSSCGSTELGDGCVCAPGTVARVITTPMIGGSSLNSTVVCDDLAFEMLGSLQEVGFSPDDPCSDVSCGDNGACMALNGFPTCACDEGFAAVQDGGFLTCAEATATFEPDQLLWTAGCGSCSTGDSEAGGFLALLGLLGLVRRRMRG